MHDGCQRIIGGRGTTTQLCSSHHHSVIFRCDGSADHHRIVVFRRDNSTGHHNSHIGPFRHDDSAGRSQRAKESSSQVNQAQGSIRTSNQLKPQSDLTRERNKRPAQICFLTDPRRSLTKPAGNPNLPEQLTIQLNTKPNLLSTYGQGSRLLNKALLALTKLEWEESLTQKLKSERENHRLGFVKLLKSATTSLLFHKSTYHSKLVSIERSKQDEPSTTNLSPNKDGNRRQSNGEGFR
ncbi:hypothetical protein F511_33866 [Dorcoceras hygrometricum]|uniref:Uncharacterized protein n=1 Tax=Dorcoceras hygrometricum TaxID=472368 RepID=A0A2Z7A2P0_9LAMI|nr:hypothetical protein F511_33866 [Dorcoceras hygrometricum]